MEKNNSSEEVGRADYFLDITSETCPLTFVKTKLLIEKMPSGSIAEIRLKGKEPLDNVPRSVQDIGHLILNLKPESGGKETEGIHRLLIKKS